MTQDTYLKPRLFIADGDSAVDLFGWRRRAALELDDLYTVVDPAVLGLSANPYQTLQALAGCHKVLVNAATGPTWGLGAELVHAWHEQKTVVAFGAFDPWITYHVTDLAPDLDTAIALLRATA